MLGPFISIILKCRRIKCINTSKHLVSFSFLFFFTAMSVILLGSLPTLCRCSSMWIKFGGMNDRQRSRHVRIYPINPRNICAWVGLKRTLRTVTWMIFLLLFLLFNFRTLYSPSDKDVSLSILYSFFSLVLGIQNLYPYFNLVYY